MEKLKLAVMASGQGSNVLKLMQHFSRANQAEIAVLIVNNPQSGAINHAQQFQIPVKIVSNESLIQGDGLLTILKEFEVKGVVLAGFLRKIPGCVLQHYENRVVNIHPSLLPKFGGKGMYGHHVHDAVIQAKEKQTGITIHLVNEAYDEGAFIAQFYAQLEPTDTATEVQQKVQKLEHAYYAMVVEHYFSSFTQ